MDPILLESEFTSYESLYQPENIVLDDKDHCIAHGLIHLTNARLQNKHLKYAVSFDDSEINTASNTSPPISSALRRRHSLDNYDVHQYGDDGFIIGERRFLIHVKETQHQLLESEDTNKDYQITIDDIGPKVFPLRLIHSCAVIKQDVKAPQSKTIISLSHGIKYHYIQGTYIISNLLQEVTLANELNRSLIIICESRLKENPVDRLTRNIKNHFWDALTRRIDIEGTKFICKDPKNRTKDQSFRIYVPFADKIGYDYFSNFAREHVGLKLSVERLPKDISPEYVKEKNEHPGILTLALRCNKDNGKIVGTPFVVPGGRFNEMYGWDSYFEVLGLIVNERFEMARAMIENFNYEIEFYGKILNANRSYYLTRSQPPFFTDMIKKVYPFLEERNIDTPSMSNFYSSTATLETALQSPHYASYLNSPTAAGFKISNTRKSWLATCLRAVVKELLSIWKASPRLEEETGLSRFYTSGIGMPPETESSHFDHVITPFAKKYGLSLKEFTAKYQNYEIHEPELDEYFRHDRAVRESGHDTTYRFDGCCANLATIDLNSLVFRYEMDLAEFLDTYFGSWFHVKVRKGTNNENLISYQKWAELMETKGLDEAIGNCGGWDSVWAKGVMVFEQTEDDEIPTTKKTSKKKKAHSRAEDGSKIIYPEVIFTTSDVDGSEEVPYFTLRIHSSLFSAMASRTRFLINKYLWNKEEAIFLDYCCKSKVQKPYESATCFYALWAGVATKKQAKNMIKKTLPKLEVAGGLVSGTQKSLGDISLDKPSRQWDYPYGWAPHQMLAWEGLARYGYDYHASRLAYRWMYMIVASFVDYNGVVPEKFNVVDRTHKVDVEYGNVGSDFRYVVKEGFGWMNASVNVGITYLNKMDKIALRFLAEPTKRFGSPPY